MVESKRSERPLREQALMSVTSFSRFSAKPPETSRRKGAGTAISISVCLAAPLEFKNSREMSTILSPFQRITSCGSAVTRATIVASRFSVFASSMNAAASFSSTTTAILSWDSLIASSVPSKPSYFFGTAFKSMSKPSASSPIATETPPAPKSLQRLIFVDAAGFLKRRWILRSSGAFPFWTSEPQVSIEEAVWDLDEPVAPPHPSRPVLPPRRITTSPAAGVSRRTFAAGAAPMTAPSSMCLAMYPSW